MENLSHYFYLCKYNKGKDYIESYYNKSDYLYPKNRMKKIKKIHIYYPEWPLSSKSPIMCVASLGFGIDNASKFFSFPAV